MSRIALTCIGFILFLISVPAQSLKIATELRGIDAAGTTDVIIQFNQTPTRAHHARVRQLGGSLRRGLEVINAAHYSLPASALEQLANDPDVAYVHPDRKLQANSITSLPVSIANSNTAPDYGWMSLLGLNSPPPRPPTTVPASALRSSIRASTAAAT